MEKLINFKPNGILDISVKTSAKGNNYMTLVITEMEIDKEFDKDNNELLIKINDFLDKYTTNYLKAKIEKNKNNF